MAKLSEKSVTVGGIQATGRGVRGEVTLGAQASARARDGGAFDPLEAVLRADDTLELRADVTIDIQAAESRRGRGAAAALPFDETPAVRLDGPDLGPREAGQIAIVEEDGYYRFVLPNPGTANQFDLLIGHVGAEGDRGFLGKIGQMAVRIVGVVVAKKAIAKVTDLLVRKVEDTTRPHALRPFGPKDYSSKTHKPVDFQQLASGPSLLLIHGTNSSTHGCFGFTQPYVNELNDRYGNRVFAFDHPSLAYSPMENALWMNKQLQKAGARLDEVDIIAHSRGGLVARSLVEQVRSELLGVRSVLFVATPNAGTHLADADHLADFITVTTNLLTVMPDNVVTDAITVGLEVLKDYVLGAAFKAIKGVAVMNPNSDVLAELNTLRPPSGVKYRAIAANYEPRSDHGVKQRARDLAMDLIFTGIDNDLVVPTRSAYSPTGAFRVGAGDRLVLDSSYGVNHSTFWRDDEAMKRFDQWLDPAIDVDAADPVPAEYTDPEAEYEAALTTGDLVGLRRVTSALSGEQLRVVAQRVGGAIAVPLRSEVPTEGSVIVLPGIMGSRLAVDGREVWANPWQLFRGRFAHLEVDDGKREVKPAGLMKQYVPLVSHLDRRWGVFPMAYDWRRDIQEAAAQLAELIQDDRVGLGKRGKSVHIVAHSMGGLVARAFIAQYPDLWDRAAGRLIQLGTPNWGSFAIPSAFLGEEFLVKALAFADVFHSEEEIVETLATFPGAYQMLPSPDRTLPDGNNDHAKIYREEVWEPWPINQDLLNDARAFQEGIKDAIDPKRFIYIAGDGHRTPYRLRVEASGSISLGVTQRGDGRVPHDFGYGGLDVPTYFVEAKHGDLSSASEVLDVLDELLESGKTDRLATESAIRGERADHELEWVPVEDLEFALGRTTNFATRSASGPKRDQAKSAIAEATKLYLGGDGDVAPRTRPLRVQVVHGSLEQAKYPVAVGWYKGLSIEGALWFADWRLDGALRRRIDRGLGPEEAGSAIYVAAAEGDQPVGAIVLGLGEFGDLTPTRVTEAVANGTMEYVLDQLQHTSGKPTLGVSAVLVGAPGRYGLGVENSVLALIAGVSQAAEELADLAFIDELEIIEYYEGFAEHAAATLQRIADPSFAETFAVPIDVRPTLQTRPGGRPGIGEPQESGAAWPRLELEFVDPDESTKTASADGVAAAASKAAGPVDATPVEEARPLPRELKYVGLTNRAQAEHLVVPVDTDSLHRLVQVAVNDPYADAQTKNTLYELLFPNQAKLQLDELDNLHLLVDETTAWIPWEVLAGRDTSGQLQPLALRTGLLRQLKPRLSGVRLRMPAPAGRHAFIVGDPPAGSRFPRLAGARREAEQVAEILKGNDPNGRFTVNSRIYGPGTEEDSRQAAEIRNDFFAQPYRVIHVAAHGVFDDESGNPLASGAVIGASDRLSVLDFKQRPTTPDLVFLNCCHIGRIDEYGGDAKSVHGRFADLAASVALALLESGVKAVVAAGWAVDDRAAKAFAVTFYEQMVGGYSFGDAVRRARRAAHRADGGRSNTWGAYQCYGDPGFRFPGTRKESRTPQEFVSTNHVVTHIRAVEVGAGLVASQNDVAASVRKLALFDKEKLERFWSADILVALGDAYYELGQFDSAIGFYHEALQSEDSVAPIRTIERLANIEARLAARRARGVTEVKKDVKDAPGELFQKAERRLRLLEGVHPTGERYALRGSLHKKRATWQKDGGRLRKDLEDALAAYDNAFRLSENKGRFDAYHADLSIQMASLVFTERPAAAEAYADRLEDLLRHAEEYGIGSGGYFERAQCIDARVCGYVFERKLGEAAVQDAIAKGYREQFEIRSTPRKRVSVVDHFWDLSILLDRLGRGEESIGARKIAEELEAYDTAG